MVNLVRIFCITTILTSRETCLRLIKTNGTTETPIIHRSHMQMMSLRIFPMPIMVRGHEITHSWMLPIRQHTLDASDHKREDEEDLQGWMAEQVSHLRVSAQNVSTLLPSMRAPWPHDWRTFAVHPIDCGVHLNFSPSITGGCPDLFFQTFSCVSKKQPRMMI